jgi:hypothetical protein
VNPNTKRYLPILVLVAAVAGGVYLTRGRQLTGEAGGIGIEGHLAHLGKVDQGLMAQLDGLVQKTSSTNVHTVDQDAIKSISDALEARGVSALRSATTHFSENGCVQPGSAAEVKLIVSILKRPDVTPVQRRVVSYVLLDAAKHAIGDLKIGKVASPGDKPFSSHPGIAKAVDDMKAGAFDGELPKPGTSVDPSATIWDCTFGALQGVADALRAGVVDASTLQRQALEGLDLLPKDHPAAVGFVQVATMAASAAKKPASDYLQIIERKDLSDVVRGIACKAAVDTGVELSTLKTSIGERPPRPLVSCLVSAGDEDTIREAVKASDFNLRMQALRKLPIPATAEGVKTALDAAALPEISPRERAVRIGAIAGAATKCADPAACLAPLDTFVQNKPNLKLPQHLASALHAANPKHPMLSAAVGEPKVGIAATLGQIAKGDAPVQLPSSIAAKPAAGASDAADTAGLELSAPDASAVCDLVIEPGLAQKTIDEAFHNIESGVVCASPGRYVGPVVVSKPNILLRALQGAVVLEGPVIVEVPTTLVGFQVEGPVVVAETAHGAVLANNMLKAGGVTLTAQLGLVGNTMDEGKTFEAPGGVMSPAQASSNLVLKGQQSKKLGVGESVIALDARWPPRI